jgi:hypothetical protein
MWIATLKREAVTVLAKCLLNCATGLDCWRENLSFQILSARQTAVTRHIFLTYAEPRKVISTLAIVSLVLVGLYFYFGRMTFYLWVLSVAVVIGFIQAVRQLSRRGPIIIINEQGINDKRLGVGVVRWSDVEGARMHGVAGAYFISLQVANREQYLARQPVYIRISNALWRIFDVSPIHIKIAYMDVSAGELFEMIMDEVEESRSGR